MKFKNLLLMALMASALPLALLGQEFDHLTYFTQTSTDDFKHGTPYLVDIADGSVSLQYRMESVAEWASTSNMPQTLKQHQVVTWRDWVYLVGGSSNGTNAVNSVYRATQQANGISGWTTLNAMPAALKDMAVVATQTRLFVMGGRNDNGVSDKIYSAPFNNDGSIGSWTESELTLPNPACGMRAVLAMGNVYLLGGIAVVDSVETVTSNAYLMKVNADGDITAIAAATSLPEARYGHAVAFYDSKIYVTGGCDANATATNTVWSSTISTSNTLGTWATRTEMPEALYDHTAVFANGVLAILGGHNGSIASDAFYYTALDATALTWTQSDIFMPERKTQGASFAFGDKIFFCGGETLSGVINNNVSYMAVTTQNKPIRKTAFVSEPFYVGTAKTLKQLEYTIDLGTGTSCEILYRTASANKVFGNWTSKSSNNPATINSSKCYVQYMFRFTTTSGCTQNLSLQDVTLVVNGYSQLAGNLNDIPTLTLAGSPYWVTQDISFTSGTHNIEAGVTIMFLNNTGMSIGQASVNFNGTQANPILLTAYDGVNGSWNGVYFQDASDNGVTSVMNYTTIEKAGRGDNGANLHLYYTNQPTISHCTFKLSTAAQGVWFQNSSPTISNCTFTQNEGAGLWLTNASPECTSCTMSYNGTSGIVLNNSAPTCTSCTMMGNAFAGIRYHSSNFNATFNGVVSKNNLYGIYSCTPDHSFTFGSSSISLSGNTGAGIAIAGGQIGSDQTWNKYTGGYALLGNVEIYGGTPKLTVQAGTTIKGNTGCGLYVGAGGSQGGMLYAVGTTSSPITFTSLNGEVGGWDGVRFRDGSDYSSNSSMRRCVVEKGTTNLVCENTNQPSVKWCTLQDAQNEDVYLNNASISIEGSTIKNAKKGIYVNSSSPTLVSVVFDNLSEACVWHNNTCNPTYSDCTMSNSLCGIRFETCNRDMVNDYNGITFQNLMANIAVPGGDINENRTWDSNSYAILGSIKVVKGGQNYSGEPCRLTLSPGCTLKFAENADLQISNYYTTQPYSTVYYHYFRGELEAVGTEEEPITFTSLNGEVGGWSGIYFHDQSDSYEGQQSHLKHCIIEKGNSYNLYLSSTNQPSLIENCIFQNAVGYGAYFSGLDDVTLNNCQVLNNGNHGIRSASALIGMHNVQILNNGGYGMYYTNAHYMDCFENVSIEGNLNGQIAIGGGDISEDRTWNAYEYHILGSIKVVKGGQNYSGGPCRLTLSPGCTLKFAENTNLQISNYYTTQPYSTVYYHYFRGELEAVGTEEEPITFTSLNGEVGGWSGIYFHDQSDNYEGQQSHLKHCIIEKGNSYNLYLSSTNQPSLIENCTFQNANGYGLYFYDCGNGVTVSDCQFQNNGNYGLYFNNAYHVHDFNNLTFTDNLHDGIAIGGGDISEDRTWNAYEYHILGSIKVVKGGQNYSGGPCRLTLSPGCTLKFAENANLQISNYYTTQPYSIVYYHYFRGELEAIGTEEEPITFTSLNGEVGGWSGIYFHDQSDNYEGQQSHLKHCIIEKGNSYNLYLSSTNQPSLIENCIFQNANGYGLYFYNASPNLGKCVIKNNASHGIYLNSNANPVVGGSAENANSIYGNGGYQAYQDGGQNVNMSYNFWGQPGYKQVDEDFIYDKLDNSSKGRITVNPTCWFPMENFNRVRGYFTYNESQIMAAKRVKIINANGTQQAAVNTNSNGRFTFNNYHVGVYNTIDTDFGIDILAGVNATDALLVMRHYVHLDTLTGAQASAADVNLSGNINGTDAMLIMRRAVDEEFPSGDFYYYSPSGMSITGENVEYDLSFLCYGDVNGSYTPATRDNSIELLHEGQLMAESYQEMEVPVSIKQAVEMGALTLRFGYPEEYIEIEDVVLAATGESLLFTADEGELTAVWFSLQPLALAENDGLINIKVRTKDLGDINEPVAFSLSAYSELANGNAQVLEDLVIAMPDIVTETMSVGENTTADGVALSLYPNPAKDVCTMVYQLPEAGRVTVAVFNALGVKVMDAADFRQEEGRHELQIATSNLAAGVYNCRITFEGANSWVKSTLIIIEK